MLEKISKILVWTFANIRWAYESVYVAFAYAQMTDEEKETTKRGAGVARAYLKEECARLHISVPHLVVGRVKKHGAGGYCVGEYLVHLDPVKRKDVRRTLCHELRHAWQWHFHHDVFMWCQWNFLDDSSLYWVNPVEVDARCYELGIDSGLMNIPVEKLKEMHLHGVLTDYMKDRNKAFGVDKESYLWSLHQAL